MLFVHILKVFVGIIKVLLVFICKNGSFWYFIQFGVVKIVSRIPQCLSLANSQLKPNIFSLLTSGRITRSSFAARSLRISVAMRAYGFPMSNVWTVFATSIVHYGIEAKRIST